MGIRAGGGGVKCSLRVKAIIMIVLILIYIISTTSLLSKSGPNHVQCLVSCPTQYLEYLEED